MVSPSHFYVLVNLRKAKNNGERIEYFIIPSKIVAEKMVESKSSKGDDWCQINYKNIKEYENKWELLKSK